VEVEPDDFDAYQREHSWGYRAQPDRLEGGEIRFGVSRSGPGRNPKAKWSGQDYGVASGGVATSDSVGELLDGGDDRGVDVGARAAGKIVTSAISGLLGWRKTDTQTSVGPLAAKA
jgi:hypothetical protein